MSGIRTDPQLRVRQTRDRALRDLHILRVALAGDPENRRLDLLQPRRRQHRRRPSRSCRASSRAVVVVLVPLQRVAAEHRLRVPGAHQRRPLLRFEAPRPLLVARAAFLIRRVQSGGHDDRAREALPLQQAAARAGRPSNSREGHRLRAGCAATGENPNRDGSPRKPEMRADQAHSSSYLCQTRRDASASGRSSVTSMFHIAAQCSKRTSCTFSMIRSRNAGSSARSDGNAREDAAAAVVDDHDAETHVVELRHDPRRVEIVDGGEIADDADVLARRARTSRKTSRAGRRSRSRRGWPRTRNRAARAWRPDPIREWADCCRGRRACAARARARARGSSPARTAARRRGSLRNARRTRDRGRRTLRRVCPPSTAALRSDASRRVCSPANGRSLKCTTGTSTSLEIAPEAQRRHVADADDGVERRRARSSARPR